MAVLSEAAAAAFVSTGLISLVPNVIFVLMPRYAAGEGETSQLLSFGQALAAGGLLGDVFLHTLQPSHGHHHAHRTEEEEEEDSGIGLWVLLGFVMFFTADLLIRTIDEHHHFHHHHHNHTNHEESERHKHENGEHRHKKELHVQRSTIFLNLAADALHNFTDGLAIGATYSMHTRKDHPADTAAFTLASVLALLTRTRGGLATVSILFHEIPHELGDFCTLVRAGYSKTQAVLAQFGTAVAAFAGTATALTVASHEPLAQERLLHVTAGGFVYLAATTLLPEVLEASTKRRPMIRLGQLLSFCIGVACLYMVALMEETESLDQQQEHHHAKHTHHHHDHDDL
jgi:zinc transporter 7